MNNTSTKQYTTDYFPSYPQVQLGKTLAEVLRAAEMADATIEPLCEIDPSTETLSLGVTFDGAWIIDMFGTERTFITGLSQSELHYVIRELLGFSSEDDQCTPAETLYSLSHSAKSVAGISGVYPLDEIRLIEKMLEHMPNAAGNMDLLYDPNVKHQQLVGEQIFGEEIHFNLAFKRGNRWLSNAFGEGKDLCTNLTESAMNTICDEFARLEADRPDNTRDNLRTATRNATKI